jgi:hypothetical protein
MKVRETEPGIGVQPSYGRGTEPSRCPASGNRHIYPIRLYGTEPIVEVNQVEAIEQAMAST